jgi:hypothetical protein
LPQLENRSISGQTWWDFSERTTIVKRTITTTLAALLLTTGSAAFAGHGFIDFDDAGNMVISGPFNAIIPKPEAARIGGPEHSTPSFLDENLKVSKAGYFGDDQFVVVQVEQTNAGRGTLTNTNLPVMELAGQEFRARTGCIDISQEALDADDDPLFEFTETQNVQIVPAVNALQLFFVDDSGTAEGIILFMRNVPGGCASMSDEFEARFKSDVERFLDTIRAAN